VEVKNKIHTIRRASEQQRPRRGGNGSCKRLLGKVTDRQAAREKDNVCDSVPGTVGRTTVRQGGGDQGREWARIGALGGIFLAKKRRSRQEKDIITSLRRRQKEGGCLLYLTTLLDGKCEPGDGEAENRGKQTGGGGTNLGLEKTFGAPMLCTRMRPGSRKKEETSRR